MPVEITLEPLGSASTTLPPVDFHWDAETEILSARLRTPPGAGQGAPAGATEETVELCGTDGSWLMLDLERAHLCGIEVAVWPAVGARAGLSAPPVAGAARARLATGTARGGGINTLVSAESDESARTLHFRFGRAPAARTVRLGGDFLLDVDAGNRMAGLWLLNVPPAPNHA